MKSLTIHGLDDELARLLEKKAQKEDTSLNKTIKKLLAESLGYADKKKSRQKNDFSEFFGVWTDKDLKEFEKATQDQEKIYKEDWV